MRYVVLICDSHDLPSLEMGSYKIFDTNKEAVIYISELERKKIHYKGVYGLYDLNVNRSYDLVTTTVTEQVFRDCAIETPKERGIGSATSGGGFAGVAGTGGIGSATSGGGMDHF